jgi:hypothetical protein
VPYLALKFLVFYPLKTRKQVAKSGGLVAIVINSIPHTRTAQNVSADSKYSEQAPDLNSSRNTSDIDSAQNFKSPRSTIDEASTIRGRN